jgi:hypothetical protein
MKRFITDQEVKMHSEPILQKLRARVVPRSNLLIQRLRKDHQESTPDQECMVYLANIGKTPDLTVVERNQTLNLSNYTEKRLRKTLLTRRLIREIKVTTGKKGGQPVLLELTEVGRNLLKDAGMSIRHECKGGVKHIYWQKQIKEFFQSKGFAVELEGRGKDCNVDVLVVSSNGRRIAVEVATSPEYELTNIQKCIRSDFERIIVASENLKIQEKIGSQALSACDSKDLKKIQFCLVHDFVA